MNEEIRRLLASTSRCLAVLLTGAILANCSTFSSSTQRNNFSEISRELKNIALGKNSSILRSDHSAGVLVIFNTSAPHPVPVAVAKGETASAAMFSLLTDGRDPCLTSANALTIAGYAPASNVALPYEFMQCIELRDKVKILIAQTQALDRLVVAAKGNRASLNQLATDLAAIANEQEVSWDKVKDQMKDMNQAVQKYQENSAGK